MRIFRKRFAAVLLTVAAATLTVTTTPASATAASVSGWTAATLKAFGPSAFTFSGTSKTGAAIKCIGTANSPHWSSGGDSVIYKTRVTCNATVMVTIDGALMYVAGGSPGKPAAGPGQRVAKSTQSQWVSPGQTKTYYTPRSDSGIHIRKSGTYYGVSRGQIMDPCCSNIDGTSSAHTYVTAR
ncbi:hypothetical protein FAF44_49540 [Nonomuraea sp. MG754425]|uniref:hypothetical protein n=1 Tax=Nonomuraea sp. MG754425 TaxID=2570319 RepID=UPI001F427974|nr:hypothetical protein [Nonomuraea sp. MG754425]MCF6476333.1 hypothetical protein [Nonomuraea sp. MG754425]